ncbi:MAG: bifunctional DNA primase/polymerase, partial [Paracoccaceae bacterium]
MSELLPSPFADWAANYIERGYSVIPLQPQDKAPAISGWSEYCTRMPTEAEVDGWSDAYPFANVGLACGEVWVIDV